MTSKSFESTRSRRGKRERITDRDVYDYTLRVAYLRHILTPKPSTTADPKSSNAATKSSESKDSRYRMSGISSAIGLDSIMGLFSDSSAREGSKSPKFPKEFITVLGNKLENIAMNRDPGYTEQLLRRTVAIFWGSLQDPSFHRTMKENRKIEDLILMFVSTSDATLKKNKELSVEGRKEELNRQIAQFVRILRDAMRERGVGHVPAELTAKLERYVDFLAPVAEGNGWVDVGSSSSPPSAYPAASSSTTATNGAGPSGSVMFSSVSEMAMVQTVARLFGHTDQEVQADLAALRKTCTAKAAVADLKTCLKNITLDAPFPGRREDFDGDEAWQHWKHAEISQLTKLINDMIAQDPDLAKSTPERPSSGIGTRPGSVAGGRNSPRPQSSYGGIGSNRDVGDDPTVSRRTSAASRYSLTLPSFPADLTDGTIDEDSADPSNSNSSSSSFPSSAFTFIPSTSPKRYYKRLLELCVDSDLRAMASLQGDEEVSLGILSSPHLELLDECATRWRVGSPYRVTVGLDVIKYKYEREEVPLECIPEAMMMVGKTVEELVLDDWMIEDATYLTKVYGELFNIFLGALYHAFDFLPSLELETIQPAINIISSIRDTGLLESLNVDISARIDELAGRVRQIAAQEYSLKAQEEFASQVGVNRALPLLKMTDWIEKQAKRLDGRFPDPLFGTLDVVALAVENYVPLFLNDLEAARRRLLEGSMNQPTPDVPTQDMFALYRRTKSMLALLKAFCPRLQDDFDLIDYFRPYVQQWLINTDNMTGSWVKSAIAEDAFEAVGEEGHSSSIVDLFEFMKPPIDFILDLEWPDKYEEARFLTSLSKTISKCIEHYCRTVEELFMAEMYPRAAPDAQQNPRGLIERARLLTIAGERPVVPFNFSASSCVKLNNIEAARKLLDQLYARIDADKVTETLEQLAPPIPDKGEPERFLFTTKIIHAENLPPNDSSSKLDSFVTLSDEKGVRLAKTRTIYETLTPRWEETFDFSVTTSLWLMASVRDRALIGKHDTIGRAYLCLDPKRFGDFLAHDLWLDLDPQGRILIRVSMEGEKDDIQFFFGRAFRSLKRAESDMTRIFIDKMRPIIQQTLSRKVIQTLIKSGLGPTYAKLRDFYKQALGNNANEPVIPLPPDERPKFRPEQLSDEEVIQAITPLFDYFETNLAVLNDTLSATTRGTVMLRVWKELLGTIDALLLPPLSAEPTEMKPLSEKEVDIVFKWLKELRAFFYADGNGPVSLEDLQNQKYRDIVSVRLYYDWHTDALMEECVRMMQQNLRAAPTIKQRAKSVKAQRNLGTIKDRKREKRQETENSNGETIMRILRMRPRTTEFLAQQLSIMNAVKSEQEARAKQRLRSGNHVSRPSRSPIPPVPGIPPVYE